MEAYIANTKVKKVEWGTRQGQAERKKTDKLAEYYISQKNCSSGFHNIHGQYIFDNRKEDNQLENRLANYMKACGLKVNINKQGRLVFWAGPGTGCLQRMMFKLVRYQGKSGTRKILETTLDAFESGVDPYNALMIGHCYSDKIPYYSPSMDIVGRIEGGYVPHRVKSTDYITERCKGRTVINSVFKKSMNAQVKKKIIDLVVKKKYKQAVDLLL